MNRYVSLLLVATSIEVITVMARVEQEPGDQMQPMLAGLLLLYEKNNGVLQHLEPMRLSCIENVLRLREHRYGTHHAKETGVVMANIIRIFTGYEHFDTEQMGTYSFRTGIAANGICVYMEALVSMTAKAELVCRFHVIPGQIAQGSKMYDSVWDCSPTPTPRLQNVELREENESNVIIRTENLDDRLALTPIVVEHGVEGRLTFFYRVSTSTGNIQIPPGRMTAYILRNTGRIPCNGNAAWCPKERVRPCLSTTSGWNFDEAEARLPPGPTVCCIWKHAQSDVARLVALELLRQKNSDWPNRIWAVVRRGECLPCCTKLGVPNLFEGTAVQGFYHVIW